MSSEVTTGESPQPAAAGAGVAVSPARSKATPGRSRNPLHDLIAVGKMPVILELHPTEGDRIAYPKLRQRHLSRGYELPEVTVLGQSLRQMDITSAELSDEERALVHKLQVYADLVSFGSVDLLALGDGPRGRNTLDNAIAAALLIGLGVDPARLMAVVVGRDRQEEQIRRRLHFFAQLGLRNVLLLTGDLPVGATRTARFPLDSVVMCEVARRMLVEGILPEDFWIAAAGHPNSDADPDGLRTLQKAQAGAKVIITQAVYSIEDFDRWMRALHDIGVIDQIHVLAEIIPITSASQLRAIAEVPGIRIPRDLITELDSIRLRFEQAATAGGHPPDWVRQHLRNEGARKTRELLHSIRKVPGVSGFYLGCLKGFDAHLELLREAPLLPEGGQHLHKVTKISGADRQRALANVPSLEAYIDRLIKRSRPRQRRAEFMRRFLDRAWMEAIFKLLEWPKVPLFNCKKCDSCDLSPDALVCPRGCAKQMTHGPCGAPRLVNGRMLCEDTSRECTWATIAARRRQYGIPLAKQLELRAAPSAGFYEGKTYSAVLPVLTGKRRGPSWSLAWRAPWVHLARMFRRDFKLVSKGAPYDLLTLAKCHEEEFLSILDNRGPVDREEVLLKALALIGTSVSLCLFESRLAEFGLPAEGAVADLSLREQFQLAEAIPLIRHRLAKEDARRRGAMLGPSEELLSVVPEGRRLRQGMRRESANRLISHIASLGVGVTYVDSMLDTRFVEDFLAGLVILKDELQVAGARLPFAAGDLSVYFHRVHYKRHYHSPVAIHRFHSRDATPVARARLNIDLQQFGGPVGFQANIRGALERLAHGDSESTGAILLEEYGPGRHSVCWDFNKEFWKRLREFEQASGKNYDASIGGSTDHSLSYARASARAIFDRIHAHHLGDERLYILEIGVASTHRARSLLNEFRRICELTGTAYFRNITYVLADYSDTLLAGAAAELSREHPSVEAVKIDAGQSVAALGRYQGRVIHAHLCNVYDNLPTDHLLRMDGTWYRVDSRLYLPRSGFDALLTEYGFDAADRATLERMVTTLAAGSVASGFSPEPGRDANHPTVATLLDWAQRRLVELGRQPNAYIAFWMSLFAAFRLDERLAAIDDLTEVLSEDIIGRGHLCEVLQRHLVDSPEIRIHLNQAALQGFAQLLPILHPQGILEIVDLFVQRFEEYHQAFKGPAKYDGSTVNWLNGPLFRAVAEHLGCTVRFQSFRPFDARSASVALLAYSATGQ